MSMDFERITHPLRLAAGSHQPGSGKGCAMNTTPWNGSANPMTTTAAAFAALDSLMADLARLEAENAELRRDLAATRAQRDDAAAQLCHYRTHYSRTGW